MLRLTAELRQVDVFAQPAGQRWAAATPTSGSVSRPWWGTTFGDRRPFDPANGRERGRIQVDPAAPPPPVVWS